jgi:hypothetical protein
MTQKLPPIVDPETNQIINSFERLNDFGVQIPPDIENEDPVVWKVYVKLVRLAKSNDGKEVELPPRDEFAAICGTSRNILRDSMYRLHELGWITITNLNQPGRIKRNRVIVKFLEPMIVNKAVMVEMWERFKEFVGGGQIALNPSVTVDPTLHNIYY